jgi:urea carboxylase
MWNTFRETADFETGKPWLLRFFDQIRFYPMSAPELLRYREAFLQGQVKLEVEENTFSLQQYNAFLDSIAPEVTEFKTRQQTAFEIERQHWQDLDSQTETFVEDLLDTPIGEEIDLPSNAQVVTSYIPANVWRIVVEVGTSVAVGDQLIILESMKMEIAITASVAGTVIDILCTEGQLVAVGQNLVVIQGEKEKIDDR